jgi:hypothetical protein
MINDWLALKLVEFAKQLAHGPNGISDLGERVERIFQKSPLQPWEADRWVRGIKLRLIRAEEYFWRVGPGRGAPLSLFVRNDKGLNVGFKREAITQAATYVSLITDFGYPKALTQFESQWMDVAVYDHTGQVVIYAENKSSEKTMLKLCDRLTNDFQAHLPLLPEQDKMGKRKVDDPLMKAHHIWRYHPQYFWAVSPTLNHVYEVAYGTGGFTLKKTTRLPDYFFQRVG